MCERSVRFPEDFSSPDIAAPQQGKAVFGQNAYAANEASALSNEGKRRRTFSFRGRDFLMEKQNAQQDQAILELEEPVRPMKSGHIMELLLSMLQGIRLIRPPFHAKATISYGKKNCG